MEPDLTDQLPHIFPPVSHSHLVFLHRPDTSKPQPVVGETLSLTM